MRKLSITILISALSSQLFVFGVLTAVRAAFTGASFSILGGISPSEQGEKSVLTNLALFFFLAGPVLLGVYFAPRIRGLISGLLALPAAFIGWYITGIFLEESYWLRSLLPDTVRTPLYVSLIASVMISTVLVVSRRIKTRRELGRLGLGILIGISLSAFSGALLGLSKKIEFEVISLSLTFGCVWVSAVFFSELARLKSRLFSC